ncbi:MAG: hypothetical protein U1F35_20490 [Steroidobacteraceae bacterium]
MNQELMPRADSNIFSVTISTFHFDLQEPAPNQPRTAACGARPRFAFADESR